MVEAGADTITLGDGADTVIWGDGTNAHGKDTINRFDFGGTVNR